MPWRSETGFLLASSTVKCLVLKKSYGVFWRLVVVAGGASLEVDSGCAKVSDVESMGQGTHKRLVCGMSPLRFDYLWSQVGIGLDVVFL